MYVRRGSSSRGCSGSIWRWAIAGLIVVSSLITYFGSSQQNPITGETQHVDMTVDQEIALGLQAAPEMAQEYGGEDPNASDQAVVDQIGTQVLQNSVAGQSPYQFDFHLLADPQTVNAFALPGGQVFITRALYDRLQSEGELAGVLGHEIGHVIGRHSAEQIAKAKLTEGLTGAAVIATYDPNNPSSANSAQIAALIGQLVNLRYSREDELEADYFGVCFINDAGYDPNELIGVMQVLESVSQGQAPPEFFSTHPNPQNRIQRIQEDIQNINQCPGGG
jgi:predicted Zn-dependent protease